jgi:hypothetical protein
LAQCEVINQRIGAFKPDVVVAVTGLVGAGKSSLILAIQKVTSCEVVGKVESRDDSEGVTKVPSALLITFKHGLKVVLIDLPGLDDDDVPMLYLYGMLQRVTACCKGIDAFLLCHNASSTRVEPFVKQAARLGDLAIGGTADFRESTLCFTQWTRRLQSKWRTCQSLSISFARSWGCQSPQWITCTSSNPKGEPGRGRSTRIL